MKKAVLTMIVALAISVFANAQTRVQIKPVDLPKAVTENIVKDFSGFAIMNAYKVSTNDQSTFEVIVLKGVDKEKLEYSSAGVFVKKTPIVAAPVQHSPATKPEPAKK